ncbi:MAG TPA: DUF1289 domain-containing protein, partial [Aeromonadales bacterium]|nr:DUF1289 domain-containing protein [Aeromonadales bacterium]
MNSRLTDNEATRSPCIGTCSTLRGDDICQGCYRTIDEIIQWHKLNNDEKKAINT